MGRSPCCPKIGLNKGPWTPEEDLLLAKHIEANGEGCWRSLPKSAGLLRCGKSCRLRWVNYLRPNVKRGNISDDEEDLIIMLHKLLGNRWSLIAARIPGRTDNEIKNYWNTHLSKKLESRGIDPKTHKPIPQDQIRVKKTKRRSSSKQAVLAQNPEKVHETNSNKHMGNSEICDDFDTQSTGSSFSSAQAKETLSKSDSDCWVLDKMPENNTIARNKYSSASSCSLSSDSDSPVSSSVSCVQTHQNHNFVPAGNFDCPDRPQIYSVDSPDHVEDIPDDSEVLILDDSDGSEVLVLDDSDMLIPEDTEMLTVDNADLNGPSYQIKNKSATDLDIEDRAETDPSSSLDFLEDLYQNHDVNYLELSSLLSETISIDQETEISDQLWGLLDQTIPDQSDPWDKLEQENWVLSDLPILEDSGPFYPNAEDYSSVGEFLLC